MAHHNRKLVFSTMMAGSLLVAAVSVGPLVAGPKVAFNASPPVTAH